MLLSGPILLDYSASALKLPPLVKQQGYRREYESVRQDVCDSNPDNARPLCRPAPVSSLDINCRFENCSHLLSIWAGWWIRCIVEVEGFANQVVGTILVIDTQALEQLRNLVMIT